MREGFFVVLDLLQKWKLEIIHLSYSPQCNHQTEWHFKILWVRYLNRESSKNEMPSYAAICQNQTNFAWSSCVSSHEKSGTLIGNSFGIRASTESKMKFLIRLISFRKSSASRSKMVPNVLRWCKFGSGKTHLSCPPPPFPKKLKKMLSWLVFVQNAIHSARRLNFFRNRIPWAAFSPASHSTQEEV